jgi:drug/metabolite transporter (DMT)-like permease
VNPDDLVWMIPTGAALLLWGLARGFIKRISTTSHPLRFCLYYFVAISIVNLGYYLAHGQPPLLAEEGRAFALFGILAYFLDGAAWVLYYLSIIHGPITIVGTLSAAYPAVTILLAAAMVILGCIGLAYAPTADDGKKRIHLRWIPLAMGALLLWGVQTVRNMPTACREQMRRRCRSTQWSADF